MRNFFVGAGFNSVGIASAGGAGRALAQWIVSGEPQSDLVGVDIRRFASFNGNNQWLHDRVGEVLGLHYSVPWPNREFATARPFRRSPVHERVEAAGACFGSKMGWERPNFFAPDGEAPVIDYSWGKQNWIPWVDAEQRAARGAVALFDETSFGKLLVQGRDAETVLQWLCTADVAVPVGRTVYTGVLNARGTYEADVTVTRVAHDQYLWVTGAASVVRDRDWITRHVADDQQVSVTDVTGAYAVLGVMGPGSRALLQSLSRADLSNDAFPFSTSREIDLGYCTVRATRITYVGELGWELYVPAEFAVSVFDLLTSAGAEHGIANAGYYAINALRLEKGYRAFGTELTPDYNPVEAGLLFATKLKTDIPFLGREAVEAARAAGRAPSPRVLRPRRPVRDDVGRRAAAARRPRHRPGHVRRLRHHGGGVRRAGVRLAPRRRDRHAGLPRGRRVAGQRGRRPGGRHRQPEGALRPGVGAHPLITASGGPWRLAVANPPRPSTRRRKGAVRQDRPLRRARSGIRSRGAGGSPCARARARSRPPRRRPAAGRSSSSGR